MDATVVFKPLTEPVLQKILEQQLRMATAKLSGGDRNISVTILPDAAQYLLRVGYEPSLGARPLRRLVERLLLTHLAGLIVGEEMPANSKVEVSMKAENVLRYLVLREDGGKHESLQPFGMEGEESVTEIGQGVDDDTWPSSEL